MKTEPRNNGSMHNDRSNGDRINGKHANGESSQLLSVESLVGNDVYNLQGENLGDIKAMMLDTKTGQVAYAVLAFGGLMGMGEKLFAVPWNALKLNTREKRFDLDADKEKLKNAPGFDKHHWPDMADQAWGKNIHKYYGTELYSASPRM